MTKQLSILTLLLLTLIGCSTSSTTQPAVKLYAMDCGITDISDMSDFSIEGKYKGEKLTLVYPCYLVSHPKGDLIWDTGMPQSIADIPGGLKMGVFHMQVKSNLKQQLAQLNMTTTDVEFLSLSHSHFDHVGSAILMLKLAKAGPVFLTGDMYTHARARTMGTFTKYHGDQAQTKKARQDFEVMVKQQKARVIIQHEKADYDALPAFPAYLE